MPVYNNISGTWNLIVNNGHVIIAETVDTSYKLSLSPASVVTGSGETLVRKMDNIDGSVSISGPFLFSSSGELYGHKITGTSYYCYDVFHYIRNIMLPYTNNGDEKFWGLKNLNIQFGSNGSKCDASWWMDPETSNTSYSKIPWIVSGTSLDIPVRTGNWYDFYAVLYYGTESDINLIIQDFDINIEFSYDTWNPLGGAYAIAKIIDPSITSGSTMWNHATVRILKSININFTINAVFNKYAVKPPWGHGLIMDIDTSVANQPTNQLSFDSGLFDVKLYSPTDNTYGNYIINSILKSIANIDGSQIGNYKSSVSTNIKAGLMTAKVEGEQIIRITGV